MNAILVKGDRQIAETLAARPDVARVTGNPHIHNDLPQPGLIEESPLQPRPGAPATIEPGITYTHAPDVWALGFRGENIVVASADTGVRWTHNALKPHYRGWDGATPITILTGMIPFTTASAILAGTIRTSLAMISSTARTQPAQRSATMAAANQIGMAPGAKWIACRNMDERHRHTSQIHRVHGIVPCAVPAELHAKRR